jgi:benzoyl-CoA reductase subunit B
MGRKYRLVVEGANYATSASSGDVLRRRRGCRRFELHQVGGLRFRLPPRSRQAVGTLAEYCLGVTNLPMRIDMLVNYINEYEADGLLTTQSELQQLLGRAIADDARGREAHRPAAFVGSDLSIRAYFSA